MALASAGWAEGMRALVLVCGGEGGSASFALPPWLLITIWHAGLRVARLLLTLSMKQKLRAPAPRNAGTRLKHTATGGAGRGSCAAAAAHACSRAQLSATRWSLDIQ